MDVRALRLPLTRALAALGALLVCGFAALALAADPPTKAAPKGAPAPGGVRARLAVATPLAEAPGKNLSMVHVDFAPGGAMAEHTHPGTVIVYVIAGAIRSQVGDAPARIFHAGESWVETPGVRHAVCENVSTTDPAELVAALVNDDAPAAASAGAAADTLAPSGRHH